MMPSPDAELLPPFCVEWTKSSENPLYVSASANAFIDNRPSDSNAARDIVFILIPII
jgi:hypothetical protein